MEGASQGSAYPGHNSTTASGASPKRHPICVGPHGSGQRDDHPSHARPAGPLRPRVRFCDAAAMRERVQAAAGRLRLRGARAQVLQAVLQLLCGWSKISDDRLRLPQVVELVAAAGGRRYDLKTIGRALADLAADQLIVYRPAQGRGARAFIAIHDRFTTDIEVLERDGSGRVITDYSRCGDTGSVTFSPPHPYKNQNNYPPTPRNQTRLPTTRPTGVEVSADDLREVFGGLPAPLARLPRHLRWMLGREIRDRLRTGWRPDQILEVLTAAVPADVARPYRLALWRLRHNMVGAGPRLRPLQQAWDAQASSQQQAAADDITTRWYRKVTEAAGPDQRAQLLRAHEVKFGQRISDPVAALAGAGRRVARLFPQMPLSAALERWATETLNSQTPGVAETIPATGPLNTDLLIDLAISDGCNCVVCGSQRATMRPQLPLKSMVCEQCWPLIAAELGAETLVAQQVPA